MTVGCRLARVRKIDIQQSTDHLRQVRHGNKFEPSPSCSWISQEKSTELAATRIGKAHGHSVLPDFLIVRVGSVSSIQIVSPLE